LSQERQYELEVSRMFVTGPAPDVGWWREAPAHGLHHAAAPHTFAVAASVPRPPRGLTLIANVLLAAGSAFEIARAAVATARVAVQQVLLEAAGIGSQYPAGLDAL
jgi:hypothetical protein